MLPAYVIHHSSQSERDELVQNIIRITNAKVVDACMNPTNPTQGCRASHRKVAELAKREHPDSAYLVFENDCEILDPDFLKLLENKDVDILYFGVTGNCVHHLPFTSYHTWGTHAMMVNPKARDIFLKDEEKYLQMTFVDNNHPIDQMWCVIQHAEKLRVWIPPVDSFKKYVRQKPGLKSSITGKIRDI